MNYYLCQIHGMYNPSTVDDNCPKCKLNSFKPYVPHYPINKEPELKPFKDNKWNSQLNEINNNLLIIIKLLKEINEKKE